jgi:hypothetical protein
MSVPSTDVSSPGHPRHSRRTSSRSGARRSLPALAAAALVASGLTAAGTGAALAPPAAAATDRQIVLAGDLQDELGCTSDWQTDCEQTRLASTGEEDIYSLEVEVPAGTWEFKAARDGGWEDAIGDGEDNYVLTLAAPTTIAFTVDDAAGRLSIDLPGLAGDYDPATDDALVQTPHRDAGAGENFYFVLTDASPTATPPTTRAASRATASRPASTRPTAASTRAATSPA